MALYDSIYNEVIMRADKPEEFNFALDTALYDRSNAQAVDSINFTSTAVEDPDTWLHGMEGASRQGSLIGNSGILTIIVVIFLLISINFKECRKLLAKFAVQLFDYRKRENTFEEHTAHEKSLTGLMIIQCIIYGGILLSGLCLIYRGKTEGYIGDFGDIMKNCALLTAYYIFQLCAYGVVGYTFTDTEDTRRFLRSLNASLSFCGLALIVPSLLMLFYPQELESLVAIGATIYAVSRLTFISNGFSIFYRNIFSLVYFILYLCALEIIPVIIVFKLALLID